MSMAMHVALWIPECVVNTEWLQAKRTIYAIVLAHVHLIALHNVLAYGMSYRVSVLRHVEVV